MMKKNTYKGTLFIIGGYGQIGRLLINELLSTLYLRIVIAGKNLIEAENLKNELSRAYPSSSFSVCQFDVLNKSDYAKIVKASTTMLINCAGPFSDYDYALPTFCAQNNIHYVDTALTCNYICDIYQLDLLAKEKHTHIISGCGVLPSLSTAIIDEQSKAFSSLDKIEISFHPE
jgi:saccharopine dehydrogenase-like NADP-dependent oxidoreductase